MHRQKALVVFALFTLLSFHAKSQNDLIQSTAALKSDSVSANQKTRFKTFGLFLYEVPKKNELQVTPSSTTD